jgi:hypothetical protein
MTKPALGAFIISVRNAHPAIWNRTIFLNFYGKIGLLATINENAIPTAPRRPP